MESPFAGVDHAGYVVTDLDQAIAFATDVLGFELVAGRRGELGDPSDTTMSRRFGVHDRATASYRFVDGISTPIEFLAWESPDKSGDIARNCDASGRHLAVKVTNMPAALERVNAFPGTEVREPNERGYIYVKTPFGLEVQLIPVTGAS